MNLRVLDRDTWLAALLNGQMSFDVDRRFFGTTVRSDGWNCIERVVPRHWLLLALEGRSDCRCPGSSITLDPGDLIWIPPHTPHDMIWSPTFRFAEVYFHLMDQDDHLVTTDRPRVWRQVGHVKAATDRIADEIQLGGNHHDLRLRARLADMVIELWRAGSASSAKSAGLTPDQQTQLVRYTRAHLAEAVTPADLAALLDLSPNYFSRLFSRTFKLTPRAWLNRERLRAAAELLSRSHLTVYQVADRFGYSDVPQFSRQFKSVMGVSPMAYRRG